MIAMATASLGLLFLFSVVLGFSVVQYEASHHTDVSFPTGSEPGLYNKTYRTTFHFQPRRNWMNDPNGPLIYKGVYHLFYQYNPCGASFGNIRWGHSTSKDLVNWEAQPIAIYPSQPSDAIACWSGSATLLPGGKPVILYTGVDSRNRQVQNLAVPGNPSDPLLRLWVKYPNNPLMEPTPQNHIEANSFRDPTTAWLVGDGYWRVVVGAEEGRRGMAILYRSKDFLHWVKAERPLHSVPDTGMWECPDFYPVSAAATAGLDTSVLGPDVKHVMKASLVETQHEFYTIGNYDPKKDVFIPNKGSVENDTGLRYDYGKYYASKTFFDSSKNRRVLLAWVNESSSQQADLEKGWSGVQAFPRSIWLDKSGKQLVQWPIQEIEKLRAARFESPAMALRGGSVVKVPHVTADQADVEVFFRVTDITKAETLNSRWTNPQLLCSQKGASNRGSLGPFGLLVLASDGLQEYTAVYFRVFKAPAKYIVLMCSDQSRSSLDMSNDMTTYGAFLDVDPDRENLSLRSLIDHSIVESFGGGGKACITARVYPTKAIGAAAHLHTFNNGTQKVQVVSLNAWSMKTAQIN